MISVRGVSSIYGSVVRLAARALRAVMPVYKGLSVRDSHGDRITTSRGLSRLGLRLLFSFALLMGTASTALAGTYACGPTIEGGDFEVLDGYNLPFGMTLAEFDNLSSLSFVGNCTIKNFPIDNGIGGFGAASTQLNFNLPDKNTGAIIVMDNVFYTGKMSCTQLPPSVIIWWVNGAWNNIDTRCQDFLPPYLDALKKLNPVGETTQSIGVPFTYTLTVPELVTLNQDGTYTWMGTADTDVLTYIRIEDDLTTTGADLSYVSYNAYLDDGSVQTPFTFDIAPNLGDKQLVFQHNLVDSLTPSIPAGSQLVIELTVVLDDTATNTPGTTFINEVDWYLSKDVANTGGTTVTVTNVPGHTEPTEQMTIVGPYLQVSKTSTALSLSVGETAPFTIDVYNTGQHEAWDPVIVDKLPAGMCFNDPRPTLTIQHVDTAGTPVPLDVLNYTLELIGGGTTTSSCEIRLTTTDVKLAPQEHLVINYDAVLDTASVSGTQFTNVASADYWYNADSSITTRKEYYEPATNGTIGDNTDSEDAYTITSRAPYLQVSKDSNVSTLNVGPAAPYTIDVYNSDDGSAWDPVIVDHLPLGMCVYDATSLLSVDLVDADGTTVIRTLVEGVASDYTLNWTGGSDASACQFTITTTNVEIGPQKHLIISYDAKLDLGVTSGQTFTNVASADSWYNAADTVATRTQYNEPATDGTTGDNTDSEDAYKVTAAVAGYYFLKRVDNLTTDVSDASTAFPGDELLYTLSLQNFTQPALSVSTLTDQLPAEFDLVNYNLTVVSNTFPVAPNAGDLASGLISFPAFILDDTDSFEIQFKATLKSDLVDGTSVDNFAKLTGTYNSGANTLTDALSDDPYQNGPVELITSHADSTLREDTLVTIQTPGALSKLESKSQVTIGETFTYTITIPETQVGVGLYDVKVVDDFAATKADLIISATATLESGTQSWSSLSYGFDAAVNDYVLQDTAGGGIDIPPGDRAIITVTAILDNTLNNNTTLTPFINSAYYTYNKVNGVTTTGIGGTGQSGAVSVVEPDLTVNKSVTNVSVPGDPAQSGQTLRYTVDITNNATASTAYDVSIVDTLPANLLLDTATVTATIGVNPVAGFNSVPSTIGGAKVWGAQNGDGSLDIGVDETLTLTYDVYVLSADGTPIENSVYVDWSSLDGGAAYERTGAGCPTTTALNDYCFGPAVSSIDTTDTNTILKTIVDDSYTGDASVPPVLRVGDTVTYRLTVKLHEGTTSNVVVTDVLPPGMALTVPLPTISESTGANLTYTLTTTPPVLDAGVSGTIAWNFNDINNQSGTTNLDGTDLLDEIRIEYTAVVVTDPATGVAHLNSILSPNYATLAYTGGDPALDPGRLTASTTVDIHQPVMTPISKVDYAGGRTGTGTSGDPYQVDIANDTMNFRLQTCNETGLAPAYNLAIQDTLPLELDPATMPADPVVKVGLGTDPNTAVPAIATDYAYNLSGGVMNITFTDNRPIAPGECVFVEYDIGFASNIAPNTPDWFNTAEVVNYWSLPSTASDRRQYQPSDIPASVYMTNTATLLDPIKAIVLPVAPTTTVTIGEEVQYTITIPATNANLTNVLVEDTLDAALAYPPGDATVSGGLSFTDNSSGQLFSITIDSIPAGQEVVITLPVQVADNGTAVAGHSFDNLATYTYNGTTYTSLPTGLLTIVEPALVPTKAVSPLTPAPTGGDTLTYTITIPAQSAINNSQAFDLTVVDTLGDGLSYVATSAAITGMSVTAPLPEPTLGTSGTQQTLTWADLDIPYNTEVTITYDVLVQDSVVPNQALINSAVITWTSMDSAISGERTYSSTVTTTLNAADTASLSKAVVADTYADATLVPATDATDGIVRVGDTVDYKLTLNLQEGTTQNVTVSDLLPPGLAFEQIVSVVAGTGITYSTDPISGPTAGTEGLISFALGDVVHVQDADLDDAIEITYRVRALKGSDLLTHQAAPWTITNDATLDYTGAPATTPSRLKNSADITVIQPVIDSLTKTDRNGLTSLVTITDVAGTTMAFRLEACNSGDAPAYSMTITDVLDITHFDETSISIVDVSINGTSTGNYTYTYTSPTMTFVVDDPVYPNQCVDIDFDIGFRTDFGAGEIWSNSFDLTKYWSLQQPEPGTDAFAQLYTPVALPVPFEMTNSADIRPPFKERISPAEATIGEEVAYRITVPSVPNDASTMYDVAITDLLDTNLEYASATVSGVDPASVSNTSIATQMNIGITEIPPGQQAIIELHARVRNVLSAQDVAAIDNTVSYTYANAAGAPAEPAQSSTQLVTVNIVEPNIGTFTKTADKTSATAGEIVRYSVTLTAAAGTDASDVFDVTLTDTLDEGLAYAGNPTVTVGTSGVSVDNVIGAPDITNDGSTGNPQTLVWSLNSADPTDIDINEGETVIVSYDVLVLANVLANQTLGNSVVAEWTGRDGAHTTPTDYERDGSDGATGLNNYITAAVWADITIPDTNSITKVWTSDTYADGAANVRIGDTVDYTLTLSVQEGTLDNLVLVDTLPQGLEFAGIVSINGNTGPTYTAVAPFSHTDITAADVTTTGNAATGTSTVRWELGSVTNAQNDGVNNDFVIVYRARVLNNVFAHTDLNIDRNNTVDMSYDTATGRVTQSDTDTVITVLQPQLTVSKSVVPAGGDLVVDGGEVVNYTVDIQNNGTAPAYDVVLQDIIPVGMRTGGITMVNTYLVSSPQAAPGMSFAPTYDPATGYAWNFDDVTTPSAYTIPVGDTLRVIYSVTVDSNVGAGLTLTNTAQATNYYSLNNDDASPTSSATYREEYASNPDQTSVTTAIGSVLSKETTQPSAGIGEQFTYNITVPSPLNPSTTALNDVVVYDNLSVGGADLEFIQADVLAGSSWSGTLQGSINASGILEITTSDAGGIDIPAGGYLEIAITVRLLNTATNNTAGLTFTNRAWYTYSNGVTTLGSDATTGATSGSMTVSQPVMTMTKTGPSPATMRVGTPATFTLDVQNTGTSDAWNITVTDWLDNPIPGGMCDAGVSGVSATIYEADGTTAVLPLVAGTHYDTSFTVSGTDPRCEFVFTTKAPAFVAPGQRLKVTYSVALDADNIDGSTLRNIAGATQWLSADPASGVYNTYTAALSDGTVGTTDHQDAYSVTVEGAILAPLKTVENLTTGLSGSNASPGDRLRYTIAIQNTTDIPLSNFSLVDELDRLNATPMFQAGSIANVNVPAGATFAINGNTLNVDGLNIAANGTVTVSFEGVLVPVITSGTIVLNQGELTLGGTVFALTDDPAIANTQDPTQTLIASAPQFQVYKTSADITGDANVLMAGDTLRYTITVKNIGSENAVNTLLHDQTPANTTYVANSTTLNGAAVADATTGSPLQNGLLIKSPDATAEGEMTADASDATANMATITFDVVVNSNVVGGTVISNQARVNADGAGTSGTVPEKLSDDPGTVDIIDDPTIDVVGNLPLLDAHKTVQIAVDSLTPGIVDPNDTLRYTIVVSNQGAVSASGVALQDAVPTNTTYVPGSLSLNGVSQPDGGFSPLIAGIPVNSAGSTSGIIEAGASAVITFNVRVDATATPGTIISNQGVVSSNEQPNELTDADGIDSNGDQPTVVVVGDAQLLSITKEVFDINGGLAEAGDELEYVVTVQNIGNVLATNVTITDNLPAGQLNYVVGSATLNGSTNGVSFTAPTLTATYGDLPVGALATLRFRATIDPSLAINTPVTNSAVVDYGAGQSATAEASIIVGGIPGMALLSGQAWHDVNNDLALNGSEQPLAGWIVEVYRNSTLLGTVMTDANGLYQVDGLAPNDGTVDQYIVRFIAPGSGSNTAALGITDSPDPYKDGPQMISEIRVSAGSINQNLNLPLMPNGVVYDAMSRTPITGAIVTMLNAGTQQPLPTSCFDDPAQQNQITMAEGFYRFDLNFSDAACTAGGEYLISVSHPSDAYEKRASLMIPPKVVDPNDPTRPFSVPACFTNGDDAVPATAGICEVVAPATAPPTSIPAGSDGTNYYLHLQLSNNTAPIENAAFNNHIPLDPVINDAVAITKTAGRVNVSRSEMVPYTITVNNSYLTSLQDLSIVDTFPPGFKYVKGSARFDGQQLEPEIVGGQLRWENIELAIDAQHKLQLLFIVGAGVTEGEYVNRAHVEHAISGTALSGQASATVRVVPDPTFDCTDVTGKVFDDKNLNGYQDEGEAGLPGVRMVTARGLIVTADEHGRFHISCAVVPNESRGSNFILKLDDRSLPSGYRVTSENPRVQRATRGKMMKFNFGATVHHVVRMDVADGVFENGSAEMRQQWLPRIDLLLKELKKEPSVLRLSYLADVEKEGLVRDRMATVKAMIEEAWGELDCCYKLTIESEVYWRRGAPPERSGAID